MNILMFTNTYLPHVGGVANSVSQTAEVLRNAGHRVIIVAPEFEGSEGSVFTLHEDVIRVPAMQNYNGSDFSVRLPVPFALTALLDELSFDLVHSHHPFLLGDTAVRMARRYQVPLVFTHHTRYEQYTHYVSEQSSLMPQFAAELATEYANLCDAIVAPSTSIQTLIRERGVESPIDVIPTGVVMSRFKDADQKTARERLNLPEDAPIVGHVGRLAKEKNLEYLSEAMFRLLKDDPQRRWIIAGSGPSENHIRETATKEGVADQIIWLGRLSGQDLVDAYAAMDLFVFSSQSETQGMVVSEAMAAGTPVVALSAPGVDDVVNNDNGLLLSDSTPPETFADKCAELLNDRDALSQRQQPALDTAERFSDRRSGELLLNWYQQTIDWYEPDTLRNEEFPVLDNLTTKLQAEWQLLQQKLSAVSQTLIDDKDVS
ncbi:glycosyltransferase [Reinekea blandensis]|uniref:Glycosyltransferase n=1 Tax=Reinekea blandensis MED297 TaxID=314283 RepID=A4BA40_9GAMM|nr:glycosyltransferase [Reinekea blandensis]EAR10796.1 Glycosyltransferase [Reinekea sp. MED297] [Reinekea blandensis MED297]